MTMIQELLNTIKKAIGHPGSEAVSDLLRLEGAVRKAWQCERPSPPDRIIINPSLHLLPFPHKHLPPLLITENRKSFNQKDPYCFI